MMILLGTNSGERGCIKQDRATNYILTLKIIVCKLQQQQQPRQQWHLKWQSALFFILSFSAPYMHCHCSVSMDVHNVHVCVCVSGTAV